MKRLWMIFPLLGAIILMAQTPVGSPVWITSTPLPVTCSSGCSGGASATPVPCPSGGYPCGGLNGPAVAPAPVNGQNQAVVDSAGNQYNVLCNPGTTTCAAIDSSGNQHTVICAALTTTCIVPSPPPNSLASTTNTVPTSTTLYGLNNGSGNWRPIGEDTNGTSASLYTINCSFDTTASARHCAPAGGNGMSQAVTTTLTQVIAAPASGSIRITALNAAAEESATGGFLELEYGTGTNCATGTTLLSVIMWVGAAATSGQQFSMGSGNGAVLIVPATKALCVLITAGTVTTAEISGTYEIF